MHIAFLNHSYPRGYTTPEAWTQRIAPYLLQLEALSASCKVSYIGHIDYKGEYEKNGVYYYFSKPSFFTAFSTARLHHIIYKIKPDVVVVAGLHFPGQVIYLRRRMSKIKILARHHADRPATGKKRLFQKRADQRIDAYLFTSFGNAGEWIEAGIIKDRKKIFEIPEASTSFTRKDKQESRRIASMNGSPNFLWVGRLDTNKDPLTVLTAFEQYFSQQPLARLYMIYQGNDMLSVVQQKISESSLLKERVVLVGEVAHENLPSWYSAADYFILASHREGGNYSLNEAMACGCIPVISNIPASMKATKDGSVGYVFEPNDANDLLRVLSQLKEADIPVLSAKVQVHFQQHLSANSIATRLLEVIRTLSSQ